MHTKCKSAPQAKREARTAWARRTKTCLGGDCTYKRHAFRRRCVMFHSVAFAFLRLGTEISASRANAWHDIDKARSKFVAKSIGFVWKRSDGQRLWPVLGPALPKLIARNAS